MADRVDLIQRYSDLLDEKTDGDELQAVALLDEAAAPYRQIEPPASLDRAVERWGRQRRAPAANGISIEPVPIDKATNTTTHSHPPTRLRTGWLRQGLGMVAAVLAVALLAGVLAVTFRNQGGGQQGGLGGGVIGTPTNAANSALPTPDASGNILLSTIDQAQQLAPFHVVQPTWVPSYLHDESIVASVPNSTEAQSSTPATSTTQPTGAVQVVSLNFMGPWPKSPAVTINELQQGTPLGPAGGPSSGLGVTSTTITIAGHPVTHSNWSITSAGPPSGYNTKYVWTDQGTTFQLMALITDPVTEQDVERMIASMLSPEAGTPTPGATTPPDPALVPLSQADAIWSQVVQTINGGIDPILKPTQLPEGVDSVRIVRAYAVDSGDHVPAVFDVQYSGPGARLDIVVGLMSPSLCGSGCTQRQVTVRGQQATEQVNDAVQGHISLWWREPGTWNEASSQPPVIQYWVFAQGLSADQVEQVVGSLEPESGNSTPQASPTASGIPAASSQGQYPDITVAQAQNQVSFKIVAPKNLPNLLTGSPSSVRTYHVGNSGADKANYAELFYQAIPNASQQGMLLVETTNKQAVPIVEGDTVSLVRPNDAARTMTIIPSSEMRIGVNGVIVTRFDVADSNAKQTYYVWNHDGVSSYIQVMTEQNASSSNFESDLQGMIGGLINARQGHGLASSSVITDILSVLRGLVLTLILVAIYHMRRTMLWVKAVFAIVALFTVFLFIDGIVSGPAIADVGLVGGATLVLGAVLLYERWHHPRYHAVER